MRGGIVGGAALRAWVERVACRSGVDWGRISGVGCMRKVSGRDGADGVDDAGIPTLAFCVGPRNAGWICEKGVGSSVGVMIAVGHLWPFLEGVVMVGGGDGLFVFQGGVPAV